MQQPDEIIISAKRSRRKQSIKIHHLPSFRILNSTGLKILKCRHVPDIEEENESKLSEFPNCSMPEQPSGYIKCKKHDFLWRLGFLLIIKINLFLIAFLTVHYPASISVKRTCLAGRLISAKKYNFNFGTCLSAATLYIEDHIHF